MNGAPGTRYLAPGTRHPVNSNQQIPYGNDREKSKGNGPRRWSVAGRWVETVVG